MSEPQTEDASSPNKDSIQPDPLLQQGAYIDPTRTESAPESPPKPAADSDSPQNQQNEQAEQPPPAAAGGGAEQPPPAAAGGGNQGFAPGVVIAAEPIRMYLPGEGEATPEPENPPENNPPRQARRRDRDEMSKRPEWLPEDWTIDLRVRSSGATAGLIDRYYVEPTGQRRFRSKNEVLHFLETGAKLKRKANAETDDDAGQSGTPASGSSRKERKSSGKRKKGDITPPPHANGVRADT